MNFNSHTDVVVRVAVSLVNSLTPGEQRGRPYDPPVDLRPAALEAIRAGGSNRTELSPEQAAALAEIAVRLRAVFDGVATGDIDTAAEQVNRLLEESEARPHLSRHDGEPWHVHFHGPGGSMMGDWAASCATALAIVLGASSTTGWACVRRHSVIASMWTFHVTGRGGSAPPPARTG